MPAGNCRNPLVLVLVLVRRPRFSVGAEDQDENEDEDEADPNACPRVRLVTSSATNGNQLHSRTTR